MKHKSNFIHKFTAFLFALFLASSGYSQNALDFDGVDDRVISPYNGITGNSSRTIEAWIKPTLKSSQAVIADMGLSATGQRFTFNLINGKLRIEVGGSGLTGTTLVADGNWHHVAVTYDNSLSTGKFSLYIDGVQEGTPFDLSTAVNTASGDFRIGGRVDGVNFFQGTIDEVRVWNKAKSLAQIVADTGAEFCSSQFGLVAYHRFNQAIAAGTNTNDTLSIDDSGLGNNGRLYGFNLSGSTSNWVGGKLPACTPPSCLNPNGIGATNVYGTTADIYWTQSNTGSSFKLQYGPSGFTLGAGTKLTPTNDTVSLSGLTPSTTYDVYVKEMCSATDSSTWIMTTFNTGCGLISTFPYLESFDSAVWVSGTGSNNTNFAIDPCWSQSPTPAPVTPYLWGTRTGTTASTGTGPTTDYSGTGNYVYTEATYGSTGAIATITSPSIDVSSLTLPQLSFQYHMYGTDIGTLMVWAWNGSSYDTVWALSGDQGNAWVEGIVYLSNYKSSVTHLVFVAVKGGSYGDIAIDHVEITEAPPCPKPSLFSVDNITSSSAQLNFVSGGTKFQVEWGPSGFTQGTGSTATITSSGYTVTGLNSNTQYDFYIQNDCTDSSKGISSWVGPYTIKTPCSYTNSYFTDWDQLASNESDFCWTFLAYGSASAYARAYAPSASLNPQPYSAPNYYRIYNYNSVKNYLISPEITDLPLNNLQIRFKGTDAYTGTVGTPKFYVGTMASISDTGSFTAIDTIVTTTNTWVEFTVLLNNVPANHKHVVIRHGNNTNYVYMAIDDLYIEAIPACIPPSLGAFSQIKDTSVVLSWLPGDASTWEVEYGTMGYTQGTGITITGVTDTFKTVNGLTAQSCYDFYIRGNCTSANSPWVGPFTICTECAVEVAPYLEDFDDATWVDANYTLNKINDCWIRTPDAAFTYRWETDSSTTTTINTGPATDASGTGKYVFTESTSGTFATQAILETPYIEFSSLTTPTLSFAYHMYGSSMGNLHVLISNGNQYDTLFVANGQRQQSTTDPWLRTYIDISAYTGSPRKIRFIGERGASGTSDMAIDEVSVDEMPTCLTPTNFTLDSVNATFAIFSWTSISNGTSFKMEYGPAGFTQGSASTNIAYGSSSPTQVSGLTPNTTYDIYLTDMCDSTSWIGPITFTTLINDDAELQNLLSPSNLVCGDSSYTVEVSVKNNGLNAISNLPVGANITGATVANITTTYTGTIAPGASVIIQIGTINTYSGGSINVEAYTALSGDQDMANDTLKTNALEVISAQPALYPVDTICANDSIGQFAAVPQTGIIYNWYQNAADVTPFASGNSVGALPNQTLYVDRAKAADQQLGSGFTGSHYGNMFKMYIQNDITFTGFSFTPRTGGTTEPIAFFMNGNWRGHETNPGDWTAIDSLQIPGAAPGQWYRLNFTTPVQFNAGDTISLYLANKQPTKVTAGNLTSVSSIGDMFLSNADLEFYAGVGGAYFGSNMATNLTTPHGLQATIHYNSSAVCSNARLAIHLPVNNDTAVASFTSSVNANGADVDFDASASNGNVYQWNFGDGNTGTGKISSHTYSTAGNYKVTLTVTDSVCGTTDTISQTVLSNVSLNEFGLNETVEVYPNPNNGQFKVNLNLNGGHSTKLALINTMGQVVYTKDLGPVGGHVETEIQVDNLAPGVYYLHVMGSGKSTTVKITVFI